MEFIDHVRALAAKILLPNLLESAQTEEGTKNFLVMPFIQALGYDVFDPTQVQPEFTADVPKTSKKTEKVDYALLKDGKPIILIECKRHGADLSHDEHFGQLSRYFNMTQTARFGVLTNGIRYHFFTDKEESPNIMDQTPFVELDLRNIKDSDVEVVKKLSQQSFDLDAILNTAVQLKYTREIRNDLVEQFSNPSEKFVRLFAEDVYPKGRKLTQAILKEFTGYTKEALDQLIMDRVNEQLKRAQILSTKPPIAGTAPSEQVPGGPAQDATDQHEPKTEEEREAYAIIRAILWEEVGGDLKRLAWRPFKDHGGVLLDDTTRQPICKLWLNGPDKFISIFDATKKEPDKKEIKKLDEIFSLSEKLKASIASYKALHGKVAAGVSG